MLSDEISIRVAGLSKRYEIYSQPVDRLKQMILPKVQRWTRRPERAYFHEFWALRDASFDVHKGETVGIVGRNGSGKSTLLQLICGTLTPTMGQVSVHGRVAALLELGSGFNPEFTGRENVYLNAAVLGLSRDEIDARFEDIVAFADIGEFVEQPVKTYSSGMYVRLAFAVAINVDPEILVVDEALSVGDEAFQRKCFARIDKIRKAGSTVLFVSHAAGTVSELCNRALLLDHGELLTQGSPKYVISRYQKILYSPTDKYPSIRERIKREIETDVSPFAGDSGSQTQDASDAVIAESVGAVDTSILGAEDSMTREVAKDVADYSAVEDKDESYFEVGLIPKSTFRYDNSGASIIDPHIETMDGRRVNILQARREYIYVYRVRFDQTAYSVRCGMLIKTVTGLDLAGSISSWHGETLPGVEAGAVVEVRFRFPCLFASGAYFLNAGVQGSVGEEHVYLDRWIDGAMFKVIHEPGRLTTTTFDLDIQPEVRVIDGVIIE